MRTTMWTIFCCLALACTASAELCKTGDTWKALHVKPGSYAGYQLSGKGDVLSIVCLSGWMWDLNAFGSGPKVALQVFQGSTLVTTTTNKVNVTNTHNSTMAIQGSDPNGVWSLVFQNNNML